MDSSKYLSPGLFKIKKDSSKYLPGYLREKG